MALQRLYSCPDYVYKNRKTSKGLHLDLQTLKNLRKNKGHTMTFSVCFTCLPTPMHDSFLTCHECVCAAVCIHILIQEPVKQGVHLKAKVCPNCPMKYVSHHHLLWRKTIKRRGKNSCSDRKPSSQRFSSLHLHVLDNHISFFPYAQASTQPENDSRACCGPGLGSMGPQEWTSRETWQRWSWSL